MYTAFNFLHTMNSLHKKSFMKQNISKLTLGFVVGIFNIAPIAAAPDDYGRYYALRGNSSLSMFLTTVFTIGVVIFLIYFFIVSIYYGSKDKNNTSNGTYYKRNNDINSKREVNTNLQHPINKGCYTCPTCKGKGWIKGSEVFNGYYSLSPPSGKHQCQHCKGYGRVLTQKAEELIVGLQRKIDEYNKREEEYAKSAEEKRIEKIREEHITLQKERSEYIRKQAENKNSGKKYIDYIKIKNMSFDDCEKKRMEYVNKRNRIYKEITAIISNSPSCTYCSGNDKSCQYCKGTGKLFNPEAESLYHELLETARESLLFREGVKLFKSEERNESAPIRPRLFYYGSIKDDIINGSNKKGGDYFTKWGGLVVPSPFSDIQNKIKAEIENSQYCPYCHGTGEIIDYEVIEEEESCGFERLPLKRFYKKEKCKTCNGTGEIHYN